MITLYDNPFSPFARKVRMVLQWKKVAYESVDALALNEHPRLVSVNPRAEVPVVVDGDAVVANSSEIAAYLEDRFPNPTIFPGSAVERAKARRWQRVADVVLDSIVHDVSLWTWPTHQRDDQPPAGLIEAGRRDLERVLTELDEALGAQDFVCGELSIADLALFPHVSSMKLLGIGVETFPNVARWNRRMREEPVVKADLDHVKRSAAEKFGSCRSPYEGVKVIWRGDRIEWLFANGFAEWFRAEMEAGRVVVPRSV